MFTSSYKFRGFKKELAAAWQNLENIMCAKRRLRLDCALGVAKYTMLLHTDGEGSDDAQANLSSLSARVIVENLLCSSSYLSLVMRKPVFGVSDQLRLKPVCLADETS